MQFCRERGEHSIQARSGGGGGEAPPARTTQMIDSDTNGHRPTA